MQTVLVCLILSEVRGCFSQEGEVLLLFGHLTAKPYEFCPFRCGEGNIT
jgi:hypothetical protein